MNLTKSRGWFLVCTSVFLTVGSAFAAQLVPTGSQWRYLLGTNEASLPDTTAWRAVGFNDSTWQTGTTPLGFPSSGATGLEGTVTQPYLPTGSAAGYDCVFFRKTFTLSSLGNVLGLQVIAHADDGAIVWINGVEAGRVNAPTGPLTHTNTTGMIAEEYKTVDVILYDLAHLRIGENVLAVQAFNANRGSSDFFMEASLTTIEDSAPITAVDPAPGTTVTSLDFINVVFSESVTGVQAADLLINGTPATSIATNNPNDYTFFFPAPATGTVSVAWAASHGIADTDGSPTPFAGGNWSYTVDPNAFASIFYISEFMADNGNLAFNGRDVEDEDGDRSDWIEIYNPGNITGDLRGWYLTDSATELTKWQFPTNMNVPIPAKGYLIVWASGKNRQSNPTRLHTNFQLSRNGEFLALVDRQTNIVSAYAPSYPAQNVDVSYGLDVTDTNSFGYYVSPTPGAQNTTSGAGFAAEPIISHDDGVFTSNSITVTISLPAGETGTIRYTLDGTEPTGSSGIYTAPVTFSANTFMKVRVFKTGVFPGPIVARTYFFLDNTTRDFTSNLPIVVMNANSAIAASVAPGGNRTKGSVLILDTFRGRSSFQGPVDYQGLAELEIFGQTSASFPKVPHNIEIVDEYGADKNVSLLGFPKDGDWKLRNPYSDKCLMNDFLAYELWDNMGHYSVRRRFVEVFISTTPGKLNYTEDYYGVMVFLEKIEQDGNRVDIEKLTPAHTAEPEITGGYMWKKDKDSTGDLNFTLPGTNGFAAQGFKIHEPKPRDITTNQFAWLQRWLGALNTSLHANDWLTRTGTNHYSHYIDVDNFVDHHWIVEFPKQIDGYRLSNYMQKDRSGKAKMSPIWDWNLSFGNAEYLQGGRTNGWYWNVYTEGMTSAEHLWLRRLLYGVPNVTGNINTEPLPPDTYMNSGDPDFIQKVIDRWGILRTNVMNGDRVVARIDEIANLLSEAAVRNYAKYPILGVYVWPNPRTPTMHVDYVTPRTYEGIISEMKKWTAGRFNWIDAQFTKAPALTLPEGQITSGATVALTTETAGATIYYSLDGSDPRQPGGNLSLGARTYTGPITLMGNSRVFARARNGTHQYSWSPPATATYFTEVPPLRITEIMYHPADFGTSFGDEAFEYLELRNTASTNLNIGGYRLRGGVDFVFPNITLAGGQRVLVVNNRAAFSALYNTNGMIIAGEFTAPNNLDNTGERLILEGRFRELIQDFRYDDDWYKITDGLGFSLVIKNDALPTGAWNDAANWRPSGTLNGTPGAADTAQPNFPQVVVNEVLTHTDPPQVDAIELRNLGSSSADISNWWLSDDRLTPKKYRIPAGTVIPAGGYYTVSETEFNAGGAGFALSSLGDEIYVLSGNAAGELTGYVHGFDFGPQKNGVTFGRHITSLGEEDFVSQSANTIGTANSGPLVNNVVITEIHYHPLDVFANGAYWNNSEDEFIELHNRGSSPASLFDPAHPANTWKLDDAVEFQFPPNTTIPAGGYLLVVNFNPVKRPDMLGEFRAKFNVPAGVTILGPYQGDLSNDEESVELYQPDAPDPTAEELPYVLVERVRYDDQDPWPFTADAAGQSLNRRNVGEYADDVVNWGGGQPNPGRGYIADAPPVITAHPQDQTVIAADTGTAVFSASASGSNLRYQWRHNGQIVPGGTSATLIVSPVRVPDAGQYQAIVMNNSSPVISSNATLTVLNGVRIHEHPQGIEARPGSNIVFTVNASSDTEISYQWRHNGVAIPGATGTNYAVVADYPTRGDYDVIITDDVGPVRSLAATLTVLIDPVVVERPLSQTVPRGGSATLSIAVTNTATLPIEYRWRVNSRNTQTNVLNRYYDFFTIHNVLGTSNVAVGLINASRPGGLLSPSATISVIVDTDGDGIPDAWEVAHGFNTNSAADASVDTDGDTMVNKSEYIAGTNPLDPLSYLKVDAITPLGGATLSFMAVSNKTYSIQYTEALGGTWNNLIGTIARNTNWTAVVNDPTGTGNRYYRIATPSTD